ncbi:zinc finger, PMZ-type containing protein [Tanacetum coccineum]
MHPITWAIVRVENAENWSWFLSLIHDDLNLNNRTGMTIISDSYKGLLDAIAYWLPYAEHRKCTRHIYANFKKRLVAMNKLALNLEDTITPSIRKQLEKLKVEQKEWLVYPSGFQELEVRKGDQSYVVDLMHKVCNCRLWELSSVPYVHAMAGYMHINKDPDNRKRNEHQPPLPPIIRKMPRRPHKQRIKSPTEETTQLVKEVGRKTQHVRPQCASGGGGICSKGRRVGGGSQTNVNEDAQPNQPAGRGKRGCGRGSRGKIGGDRGSGKGKKDGSGPSNQAPSAGYSSGPLTEEYEYYLRQDEQALRDHLEEEARVEQEYLDAYRAEQEYEAKMD